MTGPRGSLVIGLLFFIAGQLAYITGGLSESGLFTLVGFVMTICAVVSAVRVVVELMREGAASRRKPSRPQRRASGLDPDRDRPTQF